MEAGAASRRTSPKFADRRPVDVHQRILEGEKERIQVFSGVVIAARGEGMREMFTVRRIVQGEGVERIFPLHSPKIAKIEVKRTGAVRRAKLYYLRDRVGKATRLRERKAQGGAATARPRRRRQAAQDEAPRQTADEHSAAARLHVAMHGRAAVHCGISMASTARKPWWRRWFGTRSERAAGALPRRARLPHRRPQLHLRPRRARPRRPRRRLRRLRRGALHRQRRRRRARPRRSTTPSSAG